MEHAEEEAQDGHGDDEAPVVAGPVAPVEEAVGLEAARAEEAEARERADGVDGREDGLDGVGPREELRRQRAIARGLHPPTSAALFVRHADDEAKVLPLAWGQQAVQRGACLCEAVANELGRLANKCYAMLLAPPPQTRARSDAKLRGILSSSGIPVTYNGVLEPMPSCE